MIFKLLFTHWLALLLCYSTTFNAKAATTRGDPVDNAFKKFFGSAVENATTREALLAHLDRLLTLGALLPGRQLLHVHEYVNAGARQIGTELVKSLNADNLDAWADRVASIIPQLDADQTFSMTRRLVVAAILKLWLQQGQRLPGASAGKLESLMVKLYDKHREGAIQKGVMEYLHVSKSGGTSWCHIAELNNCTTERYDKSYVCQIKKFDDKVRWLNMTFHMAQVPVYRVPKYVLKRFSRYGTFRKNHDVASCINRNRYVRTHGFNYYSNEYTVHGGHKGAVYAHMCSNFFNAIIIRDPLKRLVSHMKFVMWTMSEDRGYNDSTLFNQMYANRTAAFWQELGPAMVDDYFIRSLLGEQAFHLPVGGITKQLRDMAEHVLAQFDLVLLLEQEMEVRNLILYYGVGWRHTFEEVHDKDSGIREAEFNTTRYIPRDIDSLLQRQEKDWEFYTFALTLAKLDPVVFEVARQAGIQPLPAALANSPDLQCGLLRLHNRTELLEELGLRPMSRGRRGIMERTRSRERSGSA